MTKMTMVVTAIIANPITALAIVSVPIVFNSIIMTGAVNGKYVMATTAGASGVVMAVVNMYSGANRIRMGTDMKELASLAVGAAAPIATRMPLYIRIETITMLNNRGEFAKAIEDALSEKWSSMGLIIEQVSVQDVRYDKAIEERYNQAQEAEVAKQQAQNEQETAKVQAETQRIEAQGEADANAILQQSLTDDVLMQHYIDKLGESEFIVVPQGEGLMLDLCSALQSKQIQ